MFLGTFSDLKEKGLRSVPSQVEEIIRQDTKQEEISPILLLDTVSLLLTNRISQQIS